MVNMSGKKAFTLIEFSVVLVIVSLIIASVLTGQSLIKSSQIRAVAQDFQKYVTASRTFFTAYDAEPGDFSKASTMFSTNCDATPTKCDGNGDGVIDFAWVADQQEAYRAWQHLVLGGMITGGYTGIGYGDSRQANIGQNVPRGALRDGGFAFRGWVFPTNFSWTSTKPYSFNAISYGTFATNNYPATPAFSASEAWLIDTKIDDGLPGMGRMIVWPPTGCATTSDAQTALYDDTSEVVSCVLFMDIK